MPVSPAAFQQTVWNPVLDPTTLTRGAAASAPAVVNLINNGTFDSASGWTLGGDAAISGGVLSNTSSGSAARTVDNATLVPNSWYQIDGVTAGGVTFSASLGGKTGLATVTATGAFTVYLQAGSIDNTITITVNNGGSVDNIALSGPKTVALGSSIISNGAFDDGTNWALAANMAISGGTLNMTATATNQRATNTPVSAPVVGTYYQITLTISGRTAGSIGVAGPFAVTSTMQSNATFTQYAYATATANPYVQTKTSNTTLSVGNFALQAMRFS